MLIYIVGIGGLTGNAGEQLSSKALDMCAGKRRESVLLEEIEDALAEQIGHDTDVVAVVEAFSEMDASVLVCLVV